MTSTVKARLAALEKRAAVARPPTYEPFWSEEHGCLMENRGGLVLPLVLAPDEWEKAAIVHMEKLTGQQAPWHENRQG